MVLALLIAFGTAGCLITAFDLNLSHPASVAAAWLGFALVAALAFRWKYGGTALACLLAFLAGYIWRRGIAAAQFLALIDRLSHVYDSAYNWGTLQLTGGNWADIPADWPMGILGCLLALLVCQRVCRRKSGWPILPAVVLPMAVCVVVTDTVPHPLPLFCLFAGLILLLLTSAVRQENAAQGFRLTAMAVFPVTAALLALFLIFPQNNYTNQSAALRQRLLDSAETLPRLLEQTAQKLALEFQGGTVQQIDLADVGPHDPFAFPVLEVTSQRDGTLYLREQDFDSYTGTGWTSSGSRREDFSLPGEDTFSVTIQTRSKRSLYLVPYYPGTEVPLSGGNRENPEKQMQYSYLCTALPDNWRSLTVSASDRQASAENGELSRYLTLPGTTRAEATLLVEDLLSGSSTEIAHRIAALVCGSARYDLDTPRMPEGEGDFALWFLRSADSGYCVHFATAATVLLRAADIPARYVTGYLVDTEAGKAVTATEENAHAWAEYYEPLLGAWVVLEATPAAEEPEDIPPAGEVSVIAPTEASQASPTRPAAEETAPEAPRETAPILPQPDPVKLTGLARVLVILAAAILIANIQRSTRIRLRRSRQRSGSPNEQALARWQEAVLLSRLLKENPGEELLNLAQKAKFSPHDLTAEELQRFDSYNRSCLRLLRQQSRCKQLVYQYIHAIY